MQYRRRFLGDLIGIFFILALIALFVMGTLVIFNVPQRIRGSIYNQGPNGVSLFAEWLQETGYPIRTLEGEAAYPLPGDDLLFVLAPRSSFSRRELTVLDNWVRRGGTLVIAQDSRQPSSLPGRFGLGIGRLWWPVNESQLILPTLNWPPVGQAEVDASHYVSKACGQGAIHMGSCQRPLLVGLGRGVGRVFVLSTVQPFTNRGIENAGNAQLVENMVLATAVAGQRIVFDEIHHQIELSWIFFTPTGFAFWLCLLALFGFFLWNNTYVPSGRAKGAPRQRMITGETVDPVNSLESAGRQFARHENITQHYWLRLKRVLARRYGVDPSQNDPDFIESLKKQIQDTDLGTVVYLASHKDKFPPMNEAELRQWVSVTIGLSDSHELTREIYEHQKAI